MASPNDGPALQLVERSSSVTSASPNPLAPAADGRGWLELARVRVRNYPLAFPIVSLLVGAALLLAEVVIILLVLAFPEVVGIKDGTQLTGSQRAVLGAVSLVVMAEAFLVGTIDTGSERRRARAIKTQRKLAEKHLAILRKAIRSGEDATDDPDSPFLSPRELGGLLVDQLDLSQYLQAVTARAAAARLREVEDVAATEEEMLVLDSELNHGTVQYAARLVFDLASFLWKWAIAILVIRNNWVSVGVTIAGGVVYPMVMFWQKFLVSKD